MNTEHRIRTLINRLARIDGSEVWAGDLNPTQRMALEYLAEANMFSRSPSQVAEYIGTTRGTMSQTLKALTRKGYVEEHRKELDQRSISYDLTKEGVKIVRQPNPVAQAIGDMPVENQVMLEQGLMQSLSLALAANGGRSFGQCKSCTYHDTTTENGFCKLLGVSLDVGEKDKICIEHEEAR
ncbi:MarR family winged helix-turn-helix transcriptional regulator [Ruegeria faecimaris]|uniref:MarR family winged helix-turn-helix transcriptional regulator n=1 Tax=Ruegeria faecimaris TaxID=686389 RepID=UPI002492822A|nr:MarR family transcriptional regulator [Ruegeria faecimaris]